MFQATPAGISTQALAIAALVIVPAAILAALPSSQAQAPAQARDTATVERQFALACTRSYDAGACGCAATSLRAVLGRDEFRAAVLRNAGNVFGDPEHSATAHRLVDACIGVPLPPRPE
jgi:hypothetical protein